MKPERSKKDCNDWLSDGCMKGVKMRRFVLLGAVIAAITFAGCATGGVTENTVIRGSDETASVNLAPKSDKDEVGNGAQEYLAGTWITASQGYEYYGTTQAMYYVRFDGTDIVYGHMKDEEFVPDHTDKASLIAQLPGGGYIIKAETGDGDKYTFRTVQSDMDTLGCYSTWNEDEFPDHYHGGSSISRKKSKD